MGVPGADPGRAGSGLARWVVPWVAAVVALASLFATRTGPNATPDSAAYLSASEHLAAGRGLTVPFQPALDRTAPMAAAEAVAADGLAFSVQAPGVSLAMAPLVALGLDSATAARLVNAVSLVTYLTVAGHLAMLLVARRDEWGRGAATLAGAVVGCLAVQHVLVWWSLRAVSEPLFLALSTAAMVTVLRWRTTRRPAWLLAAIALAAGAALVRYVGVGVVAAVAVVVAASSDTGRRPDRRSVVMGATVGAVASLPLWLVLTFHDRPDRNLSWHPPPATSWRLGLDTLAGILLPPSVPAWWSWPAVAVLAVLVILGVRAARLSSTGSTVAVLGVFALSHVGVLVASVMVVDGAVPLGDRHLLAVFAPVVLTATLGWWSLRPRLRLLSAIALVGVLAAAGVATWGEVLPGPVTPVLDNDFGPVTGPAPPPETAAFLRARPAGAVIVSNEPSRVWLTARRSAIQVPPRTWIDSRTVVADLDERLAELDTLLERPGSVVVVYRIAELLGDHSLSTTELRQRLRLREVASFPDAVVLAR